MYTLLCAISIQILKFFCKDRRLLLNMSRTLHLFGTYWGAMMVPIQVIRWYRMQCYDGTDSCAIVVPIRRYCQSEEALKHRSQRPIEPEAVFGQMKADMHYKRFRHFGMDKVYMDLGLFGMGFNLKKYLGIKR